MGQSYSFYNGEKTEKTATVGYVIWDNETDKRLDITEFTVRLFNRLVNDTSRAATIGGAIRKLQEKPYYNATEWETKADNEQLLSGPPFAPFVLHVNLVSSELLVQLETIAAMLLGGHSRYKYLDIRRSGRTFELATIQTDDRTHNPHVPVAVWDILGCVRYSHGPIGLFYLVPMLWVMYGDGDGLQPSTLTFVEDTVECLGGDKIRAPVVCEGLPAGCRQVIHHYALDTWGPYEPLVNYTQSLLCAHNHMLPRSGHAFQSSVHTFHGTESAKTRELMMLTVAGVPLAMATMSEGISHDKYDGLVLRVNVLCSLTRSRGGTVLMLALKDYCRKIKLDGLELVPLHTAEGFYSKMGFEEIRSKRYGGWWVWRTEEQRPLPSLLRPNKKAKVVKDRVFPE